MQRCCRLKMNILKPSWLLRQWQRKHAYRSVSTWSPLATAFNTRPDSKFDPFGIRTGLFQKPELTSFEGFYALKEQAIEATDRLIEEATSNPTRPMVEIFDELSDTLCKVADLAEFVRIAHPQSSFAFAAEDACINISGVVEKLNTHKGLYEALRNSVKSGTSGDQHLAELFLFDFEQSGIHLDDKPRKRVVALNDIILQTGQRFMAGAGQPRKVPREIVPAYVRNFFNSEGDELVVNGLYSECEEPTVREAAYKLYLAPDSHQEQLLTTVLEARHEMATLCGFECYADRAINGSVMETSANVREFIDILSENLYDRAQKDFHFLLKMKTDESPYLNKLMCWDVPYYTHKAKTQLLNINNSDFSPYFSLGGCMEGLNMLCQELYGISLNYKEMLHGESWAPDVYKLDVIHETEGLLGYIYCDLYERPGKPHQDCHFTIQGGKLLPDGTYQNPIVVVMLSLSGLHRHGPALLAPSAVDNLFHEFGHALHSMLARPPHQHVAGTRTHTDLAELPSVLNEYFTTHRHVVRRFARHFQTREPIPEDMLDRLCASKFLFGASEMQQQVFYSALDQRYHTLPTVGDTTQVLRDTHTHYYGLPYVDQTAWQHRFSHLIGYGAKYYSYLISRALACTVWKNNFKRNPLSRIAGHGFRHGVLKHGGSVPPKILLRDYLGTEVTPRSLALALIDELDEHKDYVNTIFKISQ